MRFVYVSVGFPAPAINQDWPTRLKLLHLNRILTRLISNQILGNTLLIII